MSWIKRLFSKKVETKQCDIHVVVKKGKLLSCGFCKGTDLRKKGENYYVCNYCGSVSKSFYCNHSRWWKLKNTIIGTICFKCRYK